jgi:hypothetical protein
MKENKRKSYSNFGIVISGFEPTRSVCCLKANVGRGFLEIDSVFKDGRLEVGIYPSGRLDTPSDEFSVTGVGLSR